MMNAAHEEWERLAEIDRVNDDSFWTACGDSIRQALSGFEQRGIHLPRQAYVFTVLLSDPAAPMTAMAGDDCGGYACGYALVRHCLRKKGVSIHEATITPTGEILRQTEDFWA